MAAAPNDVVIPGGTLLTKTGGEFEIDDETNIGATHAGPQAPNPTVTGSIMVQNGANLTLQLNNLQQELNDLDYWEALMQGQTATIPLTTMIHQLQTTNQQPTPQTQAQPPSNNNNNTSAGPTGGTGNSTMGNF